MKTLEIVNAVRCPDLGGTLVETAWCEGCNVFDRNSGEELFCNLPVDD